MNKFCECTHEGRRHRTEYGKPGAGACYACHCSHFRLTRFALYPGEQRLLARIAEFPLINCELLAELVAKDDDPALPALGAITHNLLVARFIKAGLEGTVSITEEGQQYLRERPHGG